MIATSKAQFPNQRNGHNRTPGALRRPKRPRIIYPLKFFPEQIESRARPAPLQRRAHFLLHFQRRNILAGHAQNLLRCLNRVSPASGITAGVRNGALKSRQHVRRIGKHLRRVLQKID
jgi:hypothetical protein